MVDIYADDDSHAIPRLDVIDLTGAKKTGGADLLIVISSPLAADERSQRRLLKKIENYLGFIASEEYRSEFGESRPSTTRIVLKIHLKSDPEIYELIEQCKPWVLEHSVGLITERIQVNVDGVIPAAS